MIDSESPWYRRCCEELPVSWTQGRRQTSEVFWGLFVSAWSHLVHVEVILVQSSSKLPGGLESFQYKVCLLTTFK